jgi:hypothetical protein
MRFMWCLWFVSDRHMTGMELGAYFLYELGYLLGSLHGCMNCVGKWIRYEAGLEH